jgi:endonuclease/exonuclease/phosphatase family metal-dependent hydrolase
MRLVSYNTHKGVGGSDRRYRLDRVIEVLRAEEADLVCLQEVDQNAMRTHFDDQPALLADRLQANAAFFQLNVPHKQGGYGNLLLSRWPLRCRHSVSLRLGRRKPRGAQLVVVETPQGPLHLVNWHLGLGEKERRWQVGHLLHHMLFHEAGHLPTLIAGDYNDWRNTLGRHRFALHHFEQVTAPIKRYRSFPAFFPVASLDKVYRRGPVRVERVAVARTRMAQRASDHLPLVVDFSLDGHASLVVPGGTVQ